MAPGTTITRRTVTSCRGWIRRFHESKQNGVPIVKVWGTGKPLREFLFVDDLADACVFVLEHYSDEQHVNVGSGEEATIAEFAQLVADVVGYRGELTFDPSRPDGVARKLLDSSKLAGMGWRARTSLRAGLGRRMRHFSPETIARAEAGFARLPAAPSTNDDGAPERRPIVSGRMSGEALLPSPQTTTRVPTSTRR